MDRPQLLLRQIVSLLGQITKPAKSHEHHQQPQEVQNSTRSLISALKLQGTPIRAELIRPIPAGTTTVNTQAINVFPAGPYFAEIKVNGQLFLIKSGINFSNEQSIQVQLNGEKINLLTIPQPHKNNISVAPGQHLLKTEITQLIQNHKVLNNPPPPPTLLSKLINPVGSNTSDSVTNITQSYKPLQDQLKQLPSLKELSHPPLLRAWINYLNRPTEVKLAEHALLKQNFGQQTAPTSEKTKHTQLDTLRTLLSKPNIRMLIPQLIKQLSGNESNLPAYQQPPSIKIPGFITTPDSYIYPINRSEQNLKKAQLSSNVVQQQILTALKGIEQRQLLHQLIHIQNKLSQRDAPEAIVNNWLFELPIRVDNYLHWLQLRIESFPQEDHSSESSEESEKNKIWRLYLRFEREETGVISIRILYQDDKMDIDFWAEDSNTVSELDSLIPSFSSSLHDAGVEIGVIQATQGSTPPTEVQFSKTRLHIKA